MKGIFYWNIRLPLLIGVSIALLLLGPQSLRGASSSWFEFTLPWDDSSSSFLSYPSSGPVTLPIRVGSDGHLHLGSAGGPRIRFFGMNFGGAAAFPSHDKAEKTAKRLAKLGFNFAKLMALESWLLISTNPIKFNETNLDKLFYFIAKLKENGIYVGIQLNIAGDQHRPIIYFDANTIELQKEYARKLLTESVNPYTGLTLAQDPVLGEVQFINEIYMLSNFQTCDLHTEQECGEEGSGSSLKALGQIAPWTQAWQFGVPPVPLNVNQQESDDLDAQWNARLREHYGSRAALKTAWEQGCPAGKISLGAGEDPDNGTVERILYKDWANYCPNRLIDTVTFYYQLQRDHIVDMYSYLKDELGLGDIPITAVENTLGIHDKFAQHGTNTLAQHVPWANPGHYNGSYQYVNAPMVKGPYTGPFKSSWATWIEFRNTIWKIAVVSLVKDRPFILTEHNHPLPNEFQAEFPLLTSAYGNFQDFDGILLHEYGSNIGNGKIDYSWELADDPAILAQIPAAARVFRNGWVQAGSNELVVPFWEDGAFNGNSGVLNDWWECLGSHYCYWENTGIPNPKKIHPAWSLIRKTRMAFCADKNEPGCPSVPNLVTPSPPYISDTGQLRWDTSKGLVTVDAPRVQAAIGFVSTQQVNLSALKVNATTDFAAISLVPLDGSTIDTSQKLLLTAVSRVMNTGQDPAPPQPQKELTLNSWGTAPVLLQPVQATVTLTLPQAFGIKVYTLDETGNLTNTQIPVTKAGNQFTFTIGSHDTLWYGIVVEPTDTAAVFRVTKEGDVLADRGYYCGLSSGCFNAGQGADIAERINVSEPVEPGDVVELDPKYPGYYRKVRRAYSTLVAGVISSTPAMTLANYPGEVSAFTESIPIPRSEADLPFEGLRLSRLINTERGMSLPLTLTLSLALTFMQEREETARGLILPTVSLLSYEIGMKGTNRPLLALMGVVPVKATTENGPIRPGDLLVSSSTPGYVMRCDDRDREKCLGAIVGKALETLEEGTGLIKMLVMR